MSFQIQYLRDTTGRQISQVRIVLDLDCAFVNGRLEETANCIRDHQSYLKMVDLRKGVNASICLFLKLFFS